MSDNWIKITDESSLPKKPGIYLTTSKCKAVVQEYFESSDSFHRGGSYWLEQFIAWQPMPKPYKDD